MRNQERQQLNTSLDKHVRKIKWEVKLNKKQLIAATINTISLSFSFLTPSLFSPKGLQQTQKRLTLQFVCIIHFVPVLFLLFTRQTQGRDHNLVKSRVIVPFIIFPTAYSLYTVHQGVHIYPWCTFNIHLALSS